MRNFVSVLALAAILMGCARGESKSIEELVSIAEERMNEALEDAQAAGQDALDAEVVRVKDELMKLLEAANNGQAVAGQGLAEMGQTLTNLTPKASETSRAALTELSKQFSILGKELNVNSDQVKLLVARTFHSVSSEVETTKFKK